MNRSSWLRLALVAWPLAICSPLSMATASAEGDAPKYFTIPSQDMASALNQFAVAADWQIVFAPELVRDMRAPALAGTFTREEAIQRLLNGTGLIVRPIGAGTYAIESGQHPARQTSLAQPLSGEPAAAQAIGKTLRMVQVGGEEETPRAVAGQEAAKSGRDKAASQAEVVVTGTRLKGAAVDDGAAPVTVFDRAKIEQLGVTTLPDFFRYVTQQPFVQSEESMSGAGGQYVDLRGVGTGSTAVLIDGRPAAATASSGTFNALDLNSIPLAAVERIEIITGSASAVYGANAMGGAINIVLKRDITRPTVELRYGSAEGGADERRASLTTGYSNERFRGSLLLDYFDRGALLGAERDRWRDQDYRRFGSVDRRSPSTNPTNITSTTTANLPGLTSRFAAVPVGSTGVGLTPANFTATAGTRNLDSLLRYRSIVGEQERLGATAFGEFSLTPALKMFGEYFHEESETAIHLAPTSATLIVPGTHRNNPFAVPVQVTYLFTGVGPRKRYSEANSDRILLGMKGDFSRWDWEASASKTEGDGKQHAPRNTVDILRVNTVLNAAPPAETLNVFQDGPGGSEALLTSLIAAPSVDQDYSTDVRQAIAQLRGPLMELPAGELQLVVGGARNQEEILFRTISFPRPVTGKRTASAAFAELGLPLVGSDMQVPAVRSLRLTAAVRYDDYSDFGDTLNPQYGLVWSPIRDWTLRASHGTSFSPPNLFSLYAPLVEFPLPVMDPRRNNEFVTVGWLTGGNADLDAAEGESTTAGVVWTPAFAPALRVAATWWQLDVNNRVTAISAQPLVDNEATFGSRVIRAAPTAGDIAAGLPGRITRVDITRINFGRLKTSGVDWEAAYSLDSGWGRWMPSVAGTWLAKYSSVELPGTAPIQRVGVAATAGTIPKWKMSATLGWARGSGGASLTARYTHSYDDAIAGGGPTGRRIPSRTLFDVQGFLELQTLAGGSSWLRNLRITSGIANLFDKQPPYSDLFSDSGYDPSQGDLIGRSWYLSMSKGF